MKRTCFAVSGSVLAMVSLMAADTSAAGSGVDADGGPFTPQVPNPASTLCIDLGGISAFADRELWGGSQIGLCRMRDDGVIDEWTLFGAVRGDGSQAVDAFLAGEWTPLAGPVETWAEQACGTAGGSVSEYAEHLRPSSRIRLCEFPDGSLIESWTMFGGPDLYPGLARVLGPANLPVFFPCPWPRTCMAPCQVDPPPQVLCRFINGDLRVTSFACCCCGSGIHSYRPLGNGSELGPSP
jgi:putative hemolysin